MLFFTFAKHFSVVMMIFYLVLQKQK